MTTSSQGDSLMEFSYENWALDAGDINSSYGERAANQADQKFKTQYQVPSQSPDVPPPLSRYDGSPEREPPLTKKLSTPLKLREIEVTRGVNISPLSYKESVVPSGNTKDRGGNRDKELTEPSLLENRAIEASEDRSRSHAHSTNRTRATSKGPSTLRHKLSLGMEYRGHGNNEGSKSKDQRRGTSREPVKVARSRSVGPIRHLQETGNHERIQSRPSTRTDDQPKPRPLAKKYSTKDIRSSVENELKQRGNGPESKVRGERSPSRSRSRKERTRDASMPMPRSTSPSTTRGTSTTGGDNNRIPSRSRPHAKSSSRPTGETSTSTKSLKDAHKAMSSTLVKVTPKLKPVILHKKAHSERSLRSTNQPQTLATHGQSRKTSPSRHSSGRASTRDPFGQADSFSPQTQDFNIATSYTRPKTLETKPRKEKPDSLNSVEDEAIPLSRDSDNLALSQASPSRTTLPKITSIYPSPPSRAPTSIREKAGDMFPSPLSQGGNSVEDRLRIANDLIQQHKLKKERSRSRQKTLDEFEVPSQQISTVVKQEGGEAGAMLESIQRVPRLNSWTIGGPARTSPRKTKGDRSGGYNVVTEASGNQRSWTGPKGDNPFGQATTKSVENLHASSRAGNTEATSIHGGSHFIIPEDGPLRESSTTTTTDFKMSPSKWSPKKLAKWVSRKAHEIAAHTTGRASEHKRLPNNDDEYH